MKVIIAGSRSITDYNAVLDAIAACPFSHEITEVVSGRAVGVDRLGERWADENGIPKKPFPVTRQDYALYGRYRGPKERNTRMVNYAEALLLVWDGVSGGSRDTLEKAMARGLKCFVHEVTR